MDGGHAKQRRRPQVTASAVLTTHAETANDDLEMGLVPHSKVS
jgi:hypothetical protein